MTVFLNRNNMLEDYEIDEEILDYLNEQFPASNGNFSKACIRKTREYLKKTGDTMPNGVNKFFN